MNLETTTFVREMMPLKRFYKNLLVAALLFLVPFEIQAQNGVPLYFIKNLGQFHSNIAFKTDVSGGNLYLENNGYTLSFYQPDQMAALMKHDHSYGPREEFVKIDYHAVKVRFLDCNSPKLSGQNKYETYHNYFLGKDQSKWKGRVPLFQGVNYTDVYSGIDWYCYQQGETVKSDWIVRPGADASAIKVLYSGQDSLVSANGVLVVYTSVNQFSESKPYAYQQYGDEKISVPCSYYLQGDTVRFSIDGPYDKNRELIIDPILVFSTYSGSRGDNFGFTATYDSRSNLYAGGICDNEKGEYPVTAGAFQRIWAGGTGVLPANLACDISISKYDSSGSNLLFATYLGGNSDDYPHSLVVDNDDNLLVLGTTYSTNFPVVKTSYDTLHDGGTDIIVSKFSQDGSQLIGSTFIGGTKNDGLNTSNSLRYNYADDFRGDIIIDDNNNAFIASTTLSSDFPTLNPFQNASKGSQEGCLFELSPNLDKLIWSTYVGGSSADALYSVRLDKDNLYAGGGTLSDNLAATQGVLGSTANGGVDGFIVVVDKVSHQKKQLSYWGTPDYDQIYFLDLDSRGSLYVAGQTEGNWPLTTGVYGQSNKGQFIARMTTTLDSLYWQTTFGNRANQPDIAPTAFLVDKCNHIYLSGWGSNVRSDLHPGSTVGLEVSPGAIQTTTDGNDFYIVVLEQDAVQLLYATFFGGDETDDHVDGGTSRFDKRGVIYQSVCSSCPAGAEPGHNDFPVTSKAAFIKNVSPRCSNASFKIDLQIKEAVIARFTADPQIGCPPLKVNLTNKSTTGKKFFWDFGDGSSDSVFQPDSHTYAKAGIYTITLTAVDSLACNIADRYQINIQVLDKPKVAFTYTFDGCTDEIMLENKSEGGLEFLWDLGDGNTSTEQNPVHKYEKSGTYKISLIANYTFDCPDNAFLMVDVIADQFSDFIIPNVFTPNEDGLNDCFHPKGLNQNCDEIEWFIYNRWGELVFKSKDLNACWDGIDTKTKKPFPEGPYFSIFHVSFDKGKKKETISGTVTLVRGK